MVYPLSTLFVAVALALVSFFFWKINQRKFDFTTHTSRWALLFLLVLTLLLRLLNLSETEGNEDTSTWLSCVISIQHYPDTLWTFFNYTDSRPLTVLPLLMAAKLGLDPTYAGAQVVSILLWTGSLYFFYLTVALFESRTFALLCTWVLCLFIGSTGFGDYVSYNSEHISVLMLTVASYWYLLSEKKQDIGYVRTLVLGLLLGSLLFAKFQNVPMGLVIGGFGLYSFTARKDWTRAALLLTGSVLPTLLVNGYYAWYGQSAVFWNNYFWNYFYYSYSTEFSSISGLDRFHPVRLGFFIFRSRFHGLYFIPLLGVLLLAAVDYIRHRPGTTTSFQRINGAFACLFLVASVYAIGQSGNRFDHYLLYLLIPFTYLVVWLVAQLQARARSYLLGLLVLGAMVQASYNILTRSPLAEPPAHTLDSSVVAYIRKNSTTADRLVVWGWADRLYVKARKASGYRMPHIHHLLMKSNLYEFREKIFLQDMKQNQPALFVDAALPGISNMEVPMKPFESFPNIAAYISTHYHLISTIEGVRIYKRKNGN